MPNDDLLSRALNGNLTPDELKRLTSGFSRRTELSPVQESLFRAHMQRIGQHPDDPTYDLRGAWLAGMIPWNMQHGQHMDSIFKGLGDERLMLRLNPSGAESPSGAMTDTRTMKTPSPGMLQLWRAVSSAMNR